jgi:hypothetical protein
MVVITPLLPRMTFAQCEDSGWVSITSALPEGIVSATPQNPSLLYSSFDSSIYQVFEYYNTQNGISQLQVSTSSNQFSPCPNGRGIFIQKTSSNGSLIWKKDLCYAIIGLTDGCAVDSVGSLYIGGYFKGTLEFDGTQIGSSLDFPAFYLIKLTQNGNLVWAKTSSKSNAVGLTWTNQGLLALISVSDSISINGITYNHPDPTVPLTRDYLLFMFDESGQVVWVKNISGSKNEIVDHVACNNAKCLIQGRFEQSLSYESQSLIGSTTGRLFQISIRSSDGGFEWMKSQTNDGTAVLSYGAEFLDDGTFITGGFYNGSPSTLTFQGETITSNNGLTDGYVMRQDFQTGDLIWLKTIGAAGYAGVLGLDRTNTGVVLSGFFDSQQLNYEGITLVNPNDETEQPFIIVIDKDGMPQCHIDAFGTEANDRGVKIQYDSNHLYSLVSFSDSTSFGDFDLEAQGLKDIALWKTCLPCDTLTSITETEQAIRSLQLYPNPANQEMRLQVTGHSIQVGALAITDMLGKKVLHLKPETLNNVTQSESEGMELNISHLAPGLYTVSATLQSGEILRQRLVVQR